MSRALAACQVGPCRVGACHVGACHVGPSRLGRSRRAATQPPRTLVAGANVLGAWRGSLERSAFATHDMFRGTCYIFQVKVVLDTDVIVAGLRSSTGASRAWLRAILRGDAEIALSVPLAVQYEAVLLREETLDAIGGDARRVMALLDTLCAVAHQLEISFLWRPMLLDPDDEMVLEAAVQGGVDRLLTFNQRHFRGAERFGVRVERPGPAWEAWQRSIRKRR